MHNSVDLICGKISTMYRPAWYLGPGTVFAELQLIYKLLTLLASHYWSVIALDGARPDAGPC